jgi:hypothetical protein
MGIRMDQHAGLTNEAREFLARNRLEPAICSLCERPFPYEMEKIGTYRGMFDNKYPLYRHILKDGRTADEFLQCSPWSSGPVFFFGLRVSDGLQFMWSDEEMNEWL